MTMTNAEYDRIVRAIQLYIDGFNEGDVKKFEEAFHEDAWMFFTDQDGALHKTPLGDEVFRGWAAAVDQRDPIQLRLLSVAQMGDAAGVALAFGDDWLDFHTLVRIDGVWKITNKTASHSSR